MSFIAQIPVATIQPVDGWSLFTFDEEDGDGFWTPGYRARRGPDEMLLGVSRFGFNPTQDRFAWLVRAGFPRCWQNDAGVCLPFSNVEIDAALAAETAEAAA